MRSACQLVSLEAPAFDLRSAWLPRGTRSLVFSAPTVGHPHVGALSRFALAVVVAVSLSLLLYVSPHGDGGKRNGLPGVVVPDIKACMAAEPHLTSEVLVDRPLSAWLDAHTLDMLCVRDRDRPLGARRKTEGRVGPVGR